MTRIIGLAALVIGIWLLSVWNPWRPQALPPDAPATQFSAARAGAVLARILPDQRPHPVGSVEAEKVRGRILSELARLGVTAQTQSGMSCYAERRWGALSCATVTNIIAEVSPGTGKAVVLMAHADSVAAGPGAADDGSGVAILLETMRALKARKITGHPIVALFTDGEEAGLLGADFYLRDPLARARTGVVINVEARGNQGPSYLFQTSKGNRPLIDLYARSVSRFATSSLYGEIYKYLPNDTDLTPVLTAGIPGVNFGFIGNISGYHTPLDRRENIDPRSLQSQGASALGLADSLAHADLDKLEGEDAAYLDILERWLPRLSLPWVLPLAILAFAMIAVAGFLTPRGRRSLPQPLLAGLMPLMLLAGAVGMGFVLHGLAAWISGEPDPSFAHPLALRLALALGVYAVALLASRLAEGIACWLWLSGLAVIAAVWAPGLTPYFLFPSLVAAPLLLVTVRAGRGWPLLIASLPALLIWIGFNAGSEPIMGLKMHPLFTLTAAFGLMALLPLMRSAPQWALAFGACLLASLLLAVVAGFQPAYSARAPQRLNLRYVELDGKAYWQADPVPHLPDSLRAAAHFGGVPQQFLERGYLAPAGPSQFPAPSAAVRRVGDTVTLNLNAAGDGVMLALPKEAGVISVGLGNVTVPEDGKQLLIRCATADCGAAHLTLKVSSSAPFALTLIGWRHGLPPEEAGLSRARGLLAVPSGAGDETRLAATINIPGR